MDAEASWGHVWVAIINRSLSYICIKPDLKSSPYALHPTTDVVSIELVVPIYKEAHMIL